MTTKTLSAAERVAAGAAWLDEYVPGWWTRVTLPQLSLEDKCACVLGQVFSNEAAAYVKEHGDDFDACKIIFDDDDSSVRLPSGYAWAVDNEHIFTLARARELGFDAAYGDRYDDVSADYDALGREWHRAISERQSRLAEGQGE